MGCCLSQDSVKPMDDDSPFKKNDDFDGPKKQRHCTDTFFIFFLCAYLIGLFVVVGYCHANGNVLRVINGYDNCGNICGIKNKPVDKDEFKCYGVDMSDRKLVELVSPRKALTDPKHAERNCVKECKIDQGFIKLLNRCIPKKNFTNPVVNSTGVGELFKEISQDLYISWKEIVILCAIALGLSIFLLLLFRFLTGLVVWFVLGATIIVSIAATIYLWIQWKQNQGLVHGNEVEQRKESSYFTYAIISTVVTVIIILVIWVMRKRIQLVVQLFAEAGKAVAAVPSILVTPLFTFIALAAVLVVWMIFELWIESSGFLHVVPDKKEYLYYKKDTLMKAARWINFFGMLWVVQFLIGCQQMAISGAVASWFFTRNRKNLRSPLATSLCNLISYHLGSVALGSLILAIVQFIRAILTSLQSQLKESRNETAQCILRAVQCCLDCFERFLGFLTRNAYIEVAIYGQSFCQSGQQAFKMLSSNALRVAAINSVGDFVLFLGKVFVVLTTVLIGSKMFEDKPGLQHVWAPLAIVVLFAWFISHCFISVYEMVIDTIFICFCEDCELNDGISKPYFMSKGLMEYVENSNKVLAIGDGANRGLSG